MLPSKDQRLSSKQVFRKMNISLLFVTYIRALNMFFQWDFHICNDTTDKIIMHNANVYLVLKNNNLYEDDGG